MYCWKNSLLRFGVLLMLAGLILSGCNGPFEAPVGSIDSLLSEQSKLLAISRATLQKRALLDGREDAQSYVPKDSSAWSHELQLFAQLKSLDKQISSAGYKIEKGIIDPSSNLKVNRYTAIRTQPIRYLKVYYNVSPSEPRKIEAHFSDRNTLYTSERFLRMDFEMVGRQNTLTSYAVKGGQKMIFSDSVTFEIEGSIIIN